MEDKIPEKRQTTIMALREKFVDKIVEIFIGGLLFLGAFGALEAFLADYKREKMEDKFDSKMADEHNFAIKREGEMLEKIAKLEQEIEQLKNKKSNSPPPPLLFSPPPVQTTPDFVVPNTLNPVQQRLDWQNKHEKSYKDFRK